VTEAAAADVAGNRPNIDADKGARSVRPGRFLGVGSSPTPIHLFGSHFYPLLSDLPPGSPTLTSIDLRPYTFKAQAPVLLGWRTAGRTGSINRKETPYADERKHRIWFQSQN
jgi:hypothetical protein